jgi:phage head maturation protease
MPDDSKLDAEVDVADDLSVETRSAALRVDSVNKVERIVTVLAVPYEQPTKVPFRDSVWTEVFARSAFKGIEQGRGKRIPVTAALEIPAPDHRGGRLVGKVISSDPYRDEGLVSEVKISMTDQGDEVLALADDDALAVSVGFMVGNSRFDQDLDRYTKTRRINRAFLDHLAFVGQPAYDGAKVLAMRADGSSLGLDENGTIVASPTPRMDEFLKDPILQWASSHVRG